MTLKDESLLTAYLDGELEPDQRSSVESALLDDPELARRLRQLSEVHELIAGLPRPILTVDLTGEIDRRLGRRSFGPWQRLKARPPVLAATVLGSLALAASLLIAPGLLLRSQPPQPAPSAALGAVARALEPAPGVDRPAVAAIEPAEPRAVSRTPVAAGGRARKPHDATASEQILALLDSPRLRRIFFVTDVIGDGTSERVEELVQKTPRTEAKYGRITVSQGIVIDPLHPNEATVFAMVLNEQELRHFQTKLEQSFPERVEDAEADPIVVAQLAEAGQVAVLPGTPASEVVIPRDGSPRIAYLSDSIRQQPLERSQLEPPFGRPDLDAAAGLGGEPERGLRPRAAGAANPGAPRAGDERLASAGRADARSRSENAAEQGAPGSPPPGKPPDAPGSLAESLGKIKLYEPPQIVLVWVTSS
jgi:hypothetical protein